MKKVNDLPSPKTRRWRVRLEYEMPDKTTMTEVERLHKTYDRARRDMRNQLLLLWRMREKPLRYRIGVNPAGLPQWTGMRVMEREGNWWMEDSELRHNESLQNIRMMRRDLKKMLAVVVGDNRSV